MRLIEYDDTVGRPLPFYLAMEEYFARNFTADSFFFMWQVQPTVIIGRHQLLDAEIDTEFCHKNGIDIVRRKSGGGAVYADCNNIMFSHITSAGIVADTFSDYTGKVADLLCGLDLPAIPSDRNDVLVDGRKISGNAFYHLAGRSIVHGTMLYDADSTTMSAALTPSSAKLKSKGISSVRSRITTIREHRPDISLSDFKAYAGQFMADGQPYRLTADDERAIGLIARDYYDSDWLTGHNPAGSIVKSAHVDGVGEITVSVLTARGKITEMTLSGDFFASKSDIDRLCALMKGVGYSRPVVAEALETTDISQMICRLTNQQFIDLLF